jgi:hypothetical protein
MNPLQDEDASGEGMPNNKDEPELLIQKTEDSTVTELQQVSSKHHNNETTNSGVNPVEELLSQIDKYTDTASTHKMNVLKEAIVTSGMNKAKQEYSQTFNQLELNFFEKLFRM